jgi:hypothetical protein
MEETKVAHCAFCGQRLNLGFFFMCHLCGSTYCYIHMGRHGSNHSKKREEILA